MSAAKRGRPPFLVEPVKVQVRIPVDLLAVIDEYAAERGDTRAEVVRNILNEWALDNGHCTYRGSTNS